MIERCTELARERSIPVFIAQLDLKNAFDRISHDSIAEMLCRKDLRPQLVAVLCSWWCCSSLEVRLGHVTSDRCISVDRGVPQGAPESSLVFVMVADEILGGLRPHWERKKFAWACGEVSLSRLGYAGDVLLFSVRGLTRSHDRRLLQELWGCRAGSGFGQNSLQQFYRDGW